MKQFYNIFWLLILLPTLMVAGNTKFKGKHTKEKKIHKEYTVNANAGFNLDNSFGNVTVVTWNENQTVIDVVIRTNGNNEDDVSEKLNEITVDFTANGSLVTATTQFGKRKARWNDWFSTGKSNKVSVEVNYVVKIPVTNSVSIDNDYGTISIDKLEGNAKISCDFGQLIIGELMADNNYINFDHSGNSTIRYMKSGKINADHSRYTLEKAETLELNSDHTTTEIGEVNSLNYNNDYGKIIINKAGTVVGRGEHITHTLGTVTGSLNINSDYGGVQVDRLEPTCKNVTIRSEYASITLGLAPGYSFDLTANLNYSNLKGKEMINFTKKHEDKSDKLYQGYHGTKGSGNTMNLNSNYGGITLKKL